MWPMHAMEYHSAIKRNEFLTYYNMDELRKHYAREISQTQQDKYCVIAFI